MTKPDDVLKRVRSGEEAVHDLAAVRDELKLLICPFCNDDDFDAIGLKHHLLTGYCKPFEDINHTGA